MSVQHRSVRCANCNQLVSEPIPPTCPRCGRETWAVAVGFAEAIKLREEFTVTGVNPQGQIGAERIHRQDEHTNASLTADAGTPTRIEVQRPKRVGGFEEEQSAAEALARAINTSKNSNYRVEKKELEDSDYADRVLVSAHDQPSGMNVQIRHLDPGMIASLGKTKEFVGTRSCAEIADHLRQAIDEKAKVDPGIKTKTILLLIAPAPLGQITKQELRQHQFDRSGFLEIWVAPFREAAFPLC